MRFPISSYIGRVRGTVHYDDKTEFKSIKSLFDLACTTPKFLGNFKLCFKGEICVLDWYSLLGFLL